MSIWSQLYSRLQVELIHDLSLKILVDSLFCSNKYLTPLAMPYLYKNLIRLKILLLYLGRTGLFVRPCRGRILHSATSFLHLQTYRYFHGKCTDSIPFFQFLLFRYLRIGHSILLPWNKDLYRQLFFFFFYQEYAFFLWNRFKLGCFI